MSLKKLLLIGLPFLILTGCGTQKQQELPVQYSGIYPNLAYYNMEGECGGGAVVPWADRLWLVTYGPHLPFGSSDKLYEITPDLQQITRKESVGGTPANRMIHNESHQLFIGPYAIDEQRNVRVIPYSEAPGRYTGNARHLTDPEGKIYIGTMEEGLYEADVKTLKTKMLYPDGNVNNEKEDDIAVNQNVTLLPGAHGKGLYSGQGVLVYSNNGEASEEALSKFDLESGVLAEWNGKDWKVIRRNQFMEVSGPGGINGNKNPETDPIWSTGFDHKSILVGVRDNGKWTFFRLPKASHSYDGAHGWNTEWPRIRNVGTENNPDYLMTMHGMFWRFPGSFSSSNSFGIRPRSAYLKVIGDFTRWNDKLVFSCDDAAQKEFLNKRKAKGSIGGPGQSNSNLWFTSLTQPDSLGPVTAEGAVWLNEKVEAGGFSEPFLFAGWEKRCVWLKTEGNQDVTFSIETDVTGNGNWSALKKVIVSPKKAVNIEFEENTPGEWIRISVDKSCITTVHFSYADRDNREETPDNIFRGLAKVSDDEAVGGLVYGLGDNRRAMGISASKYNGTEKSGLGYYELTADMKLIKKDDPETLQFIDKEFSIPQNVVTIEESSVLVVDDKGRRWRLPLGNELFSDLTNKSALRVCREVATERDLFNCMGTFYELPAENADGFAKIRPVASHNFRINDYASYRGMLILTGIKPGASEANSHIIKSDDGKAEIWAGVIDDLWKMGKPVGHGGPWKNTKVNASEPSDPYLIGFYDRRSLKMSHNESFPVNFIIEFEPVGHGPWMNFMEVTVEPGKSFEYRFPDNFQSRWIRFISSKNCSATALLTYE
jgi:hypothetical protein